MLVDSFLCHLAPTVGPVFLFCVIILNFSLHFLILTDFKGVCVDLLEYFHNGCFQVLRRQCQQLCDLVAVSPCFLSLVRTETFLVLPVPSEFGLRPGHLAVLG